MSKKSKGQQKKPKTLIAVAVSAIIRLLPDRKAVERAAEKRRAKIHKKYKRSAPTLIAQFDEHLKAELAQFSIIEKLCASLFKDHQNIDFQDALQHCLRIPIAELQTLSEDIKTLSNTERDAYVALYLDHYQGNNRCDHRPQNFDTNAYTTPYDSNAKIDFQGKNCRPKILYEAMERILYACINPQAFSRLFFCKTAYQVKRWQKYQRQFRSEAREAMGKLLCVLIMHMDIRSLQVRYWHTDNPDYQGFSYRQLAKLSSLSLSRVKRAMQKLSNLAWIGAIRCVRVLDSGQVWNIAPIRTINKAFFKSLGMVAYLHYEQNKDRSRLGAKQQAKNKAQDKKSINPAEAIKTMLEDLEQAEETQRQQTQKRRQQRLT